MARRHLRQLLESGLDPRQLKLAAPRLDELLHALAAWPRPPAGQFADPAGEVASAALLLTTFLRRRCEQDLTSLERLPSLIGRYEGQRAPARTEADRRAAIIGFAAALGSRGRELGRDFQALDRWFDHDAVVERYRRKVGEAEQRIAFDILRHGHVVAAALQAVPFEFHEARRLWRRFDVEPFLDGLDGYGARIRITAFEALSVALGGLPQGAREAILGDSTMPRIYRAAIDRREETWVQCRALELLHRLSVSAFGTVAERRLMHPDGDDDVFIRCRIVQLIGCSGAAAVTLAPLLSLACADPSPRVRRAVANVLPRLPSAMAAPLLARLAQPTQNGSAAEQGHAADHRKDGHKVEDVAGLRGLVAGFRRRRIAKLIYRDLAAQRISVGRALVELRLLDGR